MAACPQCGGFVQGDALWCGQCYATMSPAPIPAVAVSAPRSDHRFPDSGGVAARSPFGLPELAGAHPVGTDSLVRPPGWRPPADAIPDASFPSRPASVGHAGRTTLLALGAIGVGAIANWLIDHIARSGSADANDLINDGLTLTVLVYLVVGICLLAFLRMTATRLRWLDTRIGKAVATGAVCGVLAGALVVWVSSAIAGHLQGDARFTDLISEGDLIRTSCVVLVAVVAAPLVEETLFRGVLLESWRSHTAIALLISAIAFSAWHLNGAAAVYYGLMGLALGAVYVKRGLAGSMAMHAAFNGVVIIATIASVSGGGHTFDAGNLRVHTPASWHKVPLTSAAAATGALVLKGPSASSLGVTSIATRATAYDGDAISRALHNDAAQFTAGAQRAQPGVQVGERGVSLPLGRAEVLTVRYATHTVDAYIIVTAAHTYVLVADAAGSSAAARQIPTIVHDLEER